MRKIQLLAQDLIEKIAAGEVVERPASIVKELVENAIDAGAASIRVEVEEGGKKKIAVIDDGSGMDEADAPLAIQRHATSKIRSLDDLWQIQSLGFRGEALAAAAAVSHFTLETKLNDSSRVQGCRVEVLGSKVKGVTPAGCPAGTKIMVSDLFFNTPARKKFLKSEQVEYGHIASTVSGFALAYPAIRFELIREGKRHLLFPAAPSSVERATQVFGRETLSLVELHEESDGIGISGWIGGEGNNAASHKHLHLFVNGRPLKDRLLNHALISGYGELMPRGRYPLAAVLMTIDPQTIDVNVHPTKREIRFENGGAVYEFVKTVVRKSLQQSVTVPPFREGQRQLTSSVASGGLQWSVFNPAPARDGLLSAPGLRSRQGPFREGAGERVFTVFEAPPYRVIGQLNATYILCEGDDGALILVDQHAAHERIGFDTLKRQYREGRVASQQLLLPEQVTLTPKEAAFVEEQRELLYRAGFEIEPFGNGSFMVKAVPSLLHDTSVQHLLQRIADEVEETGQSNSLEEAVNRLFALMACHRQIRGGDRLSVPEMEHLLREMQQGNVTHCPHGRPVMITVDRHEIERRFKRV